MPLPPALRLALPVAVLAVAGCATTGRVYVAPELRAEAGRATADALRPTEMAYRVLLLGDAGALRVDGPDPLLETLRRHAEAAGERSLTVFLGDNVYPDGVPAEGHPLRAQAEARLRAQLTAVTGLPGRVLFLPGNHDWANSGLDGLERIRRQEALVEGALGPGTFLPSGGFPGPVEVDLTDDLRLLALDTEWWLGRYARAEGADPETGAVVGSDDDFLLALADAVQRAGDRRLLVVAHHPIVSNGDNAGIVPPERHLFPLTGKIANAYVPLPVVGSLAIAVKRFRGQDAEDLGHPRYRALREALWAAFAEHEGLVYAAGHDHSLQYFDLASGRAEVRQIVSGSASEAEYVVPTDALFAASRRGFFVLTYHDDGAARMDVIAEAEGRPMGDTLLSAWILEPTPAVEAPPLATDGAPPPARPAVATVPVAPRYGEAGPLARTFIGRGYREAWAAPVTVPVLDLGREAGGLRPIRLGGGRQTVSLRLEGADGRTYLLRSIEKDPANPLGLGLTAGFAHDWAQDATSGMHPFGALVAARLSEAAGLYHTNPRAVYVPDDPRLGPFREAFAGRVMLLEEHPDGSGEGRTHFGEAEALVSPASLYRALDGDADHRVDAPFYLRARLLDLLLGDWDRHRDQWRWAAFEPGVLDPSLTGDDATKGKVYRPVARDRDWALNDRDGLLFALARPFLPKIQGLQRAYGNVEGLTRSGREQDRRFLAPLDRTAWRREAEALQAALPDDVLAAALDAVPEAALRPDRARLLDALTARRDGLGEAAMRFYDLLNHDVQVVGSHEAEVFDLAWEGDVLRLHVYEREDGGEAGRLVWARAFDPAETREVRLWARGGDDRLVVRGTPPGRPITLRLLPGAGTDVLADHTGGEGVNAYEGPADDALVVERAGPRADVDRAGRIPQAAFGVVEPRRPGRRPLLIADYTADDGLLVGAGVQLTNPGFGRDPYLRRHRLAAAVATATRGGYARYAGSYPDALGRLDLRLEASAQTALASRNFFGFGGGSALLPGLPAAFYRVGIAEVRVEPFAERRVDGGIRAWAGPSLAYLRPDVDSTRFIAQAGLPARDLDGQAFAGASAGLEVDAVDDPLSPAQGARFDARAWARLGLLDTGHRYVALASSLALYFTPPALRRLTLAVRAGGEHRFGTFPFYDAAAIGGPATLRGYRAGRFAGRSAVYGGLEPHLRLARFRAPFAPFGEAGVFAFADAGRVWAGGVPHGGGHAGYGGGLWLTLEGIATGTISYARSPEGGSVTLRLGFAL